MAQDAPKTARLIPVLVFTALYLLASTVRAVQTGNGEFIFYIVVMVVIIAALWAVHVRVGLSVGLFWCMSVWGFLHMFGGIVGLPEGWPYKGDNQVFYSLWLIPERIKYDQVIHAYGFGVTAWLCWQCLRAGVAARSGCAEEEVPPTFGFLTICVAASMGFGALNEVVEFAATQMTDTNVGGYVNTGWDLVSNMIGATVAALLIRVFSRR